MKNRSILSLLVCFSVSFGVACAPAEMPPHPEKVAVKTASKVFTAPASAETQAKLGITRWHMIVQGGGKVVIDGANAKGQVKFSSLIHNDGKSMKIESYAERGTLAIDTKKAALTAYSLPASWSDHAAAFSADWEQFHARSAYSRYSDLAAELKQVADIAKSISDIAKGVASIARVIPLPQAQAIAVIATEISVAAKVISEVANGASKATALADKIFPEKPAEKPADPTAPPTAEPTPAPAPSATPPGADIPGDMGGNDPAKPAETPPLGPDIPGDMGGNDPAKPGDPSGTTPAPAADPILVASGDTTNGQGAPLPTGNADSNLDSSGKISGGSGGDLVGGTGNDNLGSGGGGDVGGDMGGGGGGGEYATHATCRAVSCSVSAKACICKHY
jgi:hypothetical protein